MKIKTRLFFSLLPTVILSAILITSLLIFAPVELTPYLPWAIASIAILIAIAALSLHLMAGKITRPIKRLNNSALNIAAGQYGKSIHIKGPKELGELANTLNTMSECLLEHINSLKENSLEHEKAYGETACARLLQQHLLQKSIDECASDGIAIRAISFPSADPKGLLLNYPSPSNPNHFLMHLTEAKEEGIAGMYDLLVQHKISKELPNKGLELLLNYETSALQIKVNNFPSPLFWSYTDELISPIKGGTLSVRTGDYLFLMNQALYTFFKNPRRLSEIIAKVLNVFGDEGLDTCAAMLHKEISFLAKRRDLEDDLHLICIQILKDSSN